MTPTGKHEKQEVVMPFNPNREPAAIVAFFAALIQFVGDFWIPLTDVQVGVLNAVVVAVAGLVTAIWVKHDGLVPAILGFAQSVIALAAAFGWNATSFQQGLLMTLVTTFVGMFVRTQVVAPVDHVGTRRLGVER